MAEKLTIVDLAALKQNGRKFAAVSCYDYTTARLVADSEIEMILVGDSAAQVLLGHDSTLPITMDFIVAITAAVRRAAPNVCLVADMPFLSYQVSVSEAVRNAGRFAAEAGAQLIKIEATSAHLEVVEAVTNAGMAVMAHIGILPQSIGRVGKLRAQGTTAQQGMELIKLAEQMLSAGAACLLLEGTAAEVARIITEQTAAVVVGCGSGGYCDGQVLIIPDILGLTAGPVPKFSQSYGNVGQAISEAVSKYAEAVHKGNFPDRTHSYHLKAGEAERLEQLLKENAD